MRLTRSLTTVLLAATFVAMGPVDNQAMAESARADAPAAMRGARSAQSSAAWNAFGRASHGRARVGPVCNDIFIAIYEGTQQLKADRAALEAAHMLEGTLFSMTLEINPIALYITSGYYVIRVEIAETNLDILITLANSYGCMAGMY